MLRPMLNSPSLHRFFLAVSLLASLSFLPAKQAAAQQVDLELLLAVDASSSVNPVEFDLQMGGIAAAFRHPAVLGALQASGDQGIAVALMQWSDSNNTILSVDWMRVSDEASAEAFAQEVEKTARFVIGGGTAIGSAIDFGARLFDKNSFTAPRRVMDISGDGRANQGRFPSRSRDDAVREGIIINGLPILNEDAFLDRYYLIYVIGGNGAFIVTAVDYEDFAAAMLRKLIQEISGVPLAGNPSLGPEEAQLTPR